MDLAIPAHHLASGRQARRIVDFDTPVAFAAMPSDVYISFPVARCNGANMRSARLMPALRFSRRGPPAG
jgi:hypothetical protein